MRLAEIVSRETGAAFPQIMLLRHFNTLDRLVELGGSVKEFTTLQPKDTKWDFWASDKPRIDIVVVIVRDHVHAVYRILEIEAEGTADSLVSDAHRQFDLERERKRGRGVANPNRSSRRFKMAEFPSATVNAEITGWEGSEISPVLRESGQLFWEIKVILPDGIRLTEEVAAPENLYEGSVRQVTVNAYERNAVARKRCIDHYGTTCAVCGFDFGAAYGSLAEGFIHVHHLKPLAEIGKEYSVDPVADMRPLCPNCHAVVHLGGECRSIEEVRQLFDRQKNTSARKLEPSDSDAKSLI